MGTTARLDTAMLYAWVLPVSEVAVLAVYWVARSFDFGMFDTGTSVACTFAFVVSCTLHTVCLYLILMQPRRSFHENTEQYGLTLAQLQYSYFNTNPVHVLRCHHLSEMEELRPVTWFDVGKLHLQKNTSLADESVELSYMEQLSGQVHTWIEGAHLFVSELDIRNNAARIFTATTTTFLQRE